MECRLWIIFSMLRSSVCDAPQPELDATPESPSISCKSMVVRGTTEHSAGTQHGLLSGGELSAATRRKTIR